MRQDNVRVSQTLHFRVPLYKNPLIAGEKLQVRDRDYKGGMVIATLSGEDVVMLYRVERTTK